MIMERINSITLICCILAAFIFFVDESQTVLFVSVMVIHFSVTIFNIIKSGILFK